MKFYQLLGLVCFIAILSTIPGNAQVKYISPDVTFSDSGHFINPKLGNSYEDVFAVDVQPDGKILTSGASGNGTKQATIVRFFANGGLDSSFGHDGYVLLPYVSNMGNGGGGIKVLKSGKIVANGSNDSCGFVVRLLPNGAIDSSFGKNGFVVHIRMHDCSCPGPIYVAKDGSIITAYIHATSPNNPILVKMDSNGVLDNNFGTAGEVVVNEIILRGRIYLDHNDNILVCGKTGSSGIISVMRFLPNGTRDNTFGTNGLADIAVADSPTIKYSTYYMNNTLVVLPDNSMILSASNGQFKLPVIAIHLLANGKQDLDYGQNGMAYPGFQFATPWCGLAFANNEVLLMGIWYFNTSYTVITGELTALTADGKIDTTLFGKTNNLMFQYDPSKTADRYTHPFAMCFASGGKIITAGYTFTSIWLAKYNYGGFGSGIEKNTPSAQFRVYPNPSGSYAMLNIDNPDKSKMEFEVFDITGKTILTKSLNTDTQNTRIETAEWPDGVYFIQLHGANSVSTIKLVVQH